MLSRYLDQKAFLAYSWGVRDDFDDDITHLTLPTQDTDTWLCELLDAMRSAYELHGCDLARASFVAFVWVTRHKILDLPAVRALLEERADVSADLLSAMSRGGFATLSTPAPPWFRGLNIEVAAIESAILKLRDVKFVSDTDCYGCKVPLYGDGHDGRTSNWHVSNSFPVSLDKSHPAYDGWGSPRGNTFDIDYANWCGDCFARIVAEGSFPWRVGVLWIPPWE